MNAVSETVDLYELERSFHTQGLTHICGVDEAGRGPLAGPVVAAAVILPPDIEIPGLNDSKKLSAKKREALFPIIQEQAIAWAVASATVEEIEKYNILAASLIAMERAVAALKTVPEMILVDGNTLPKTLPAPAQAVVGGDAQCAAIAAASILAKVSRDTFMEQMDKDYPQYAFAAHKGYGTKLHYERIALYGIAPIHRRSFLKRVLVK